MSIRAFVARRLCNMGLHNLYLAYEDKLEKVYSCRRNHGDDICPAVLGVRKTSGPVDIEPEILAGI